MKCCRSPRGWSFAAFALTGAVFAAVCAFSAIAPTTAEEPKAPAGSWPTFGGTPSRNMANPIEKNIPAEWSVTSGALKNIKWQAPLGNHAYAPVAVAGGKVFVSVDNSNPRNKDLQGKKGILLCLREADGSLLWQATHDALPEEIAIEATGEGMITTPAVEGNRLYYYSNRCELVCADTEGFLDGKNDGVQDERHKGKSDADIVWRLDLIKELKVWPHKIPASSPLLVGDLVYVCTGNGTLDDSIPEPDAPSLVAVNKNTGKLVWKDSSPGKNIMMGQWSNPAYGVVNGKGQVVFGGGDGWVYSFEPEKGTLLWKFDCNRKDAKYRPGGGGTKNFIVATSVVYDNKVYVGTGQDPDALSGAGNLWCIDATKTGDVSPVNNNFDPKAPENKNSALVWHYGGPILPKPLKGKAWHFGRTMSTVAIHDGLVYAVEGIGFLHCFDARTGQKYWEQDLKTGVWGSAYYVDGKVFVGNEQGDLYVMAAGKEKKLLHTLDMEASLQSVPVAVNGTLYVLTDKTLYAIANK